MQLKSHVHMRVAVVVMFLSFCFPSFASQERSRDLCLDTLGLEETWTAPGKGKLVENFPASLRDQIAKRGDAATIWDALLDAEEGHSRVKFADHKVGMQLVRAKLAMLAALRDHAVQNPKPAAVSLEQESKTSLRQWFDRLSTPMRIVVAELGVQVPWFLGAAALTAGAVLNGTPIDMAIQSAVSTYYLENRIWAIGTIGALLYGLVPGATTAVVYNPTVIPSVEPARSVARDMQHDVTSSFREPQILVWTGPIQNSELTVGAKGKTSFELVSLLFRDDRQEIHWVLVVREKP